MPDRHPQRPRSWGSSANDAGAMELARRSRGTPRIANRLLKAGAGLRARCWGTAGSPASLPMPPSTGWRSTSWGWTPTTSACSRRIIRNYGGGPVGRRNAGGRGRGGDGHHRGCLRAVPDADRLSERAPRGDAASHRWPMSTWGFRPRRGTRISCALNSWNCKTTIRA